MLLVAYRLSYDVHNCVLRNEKLTRHARFYLSRESGILPLSRAAVEYTIVNLMNSTFYFRTFQDQQPISNIV